MSKLPWRAFNASGVVCVTDSEPVTEAYLDGTARPFLVVCHGATEEEGRLISAAPDLLEALEDALKCFSIATDYNMSAAEATEFRCKMRKKARAAIAKAKGKSQ